MKSFQSSLSVAIALAVGASSLTWTGTAAETNDLPHFQDVLRLLRAHLPEVSEVELNAAAVRGLLTAFSDRVRLETGGAAAESPATGPLVSRAEVYGESYGYLRLSRVAEGLAPGIQSAFEKLRATNELSGLVLDARFCEGQDYRAAADAADLFVSGEQPLIRWGENPARSTVKSDAIRLPVTLLVNRKTAGAAEALAAALRECRGAVLLGERTAGRAVLYREFEIGNGQRLLIAGDRIEVGTGQAIPTDGVAPDIRVRVPPEDEAVYFADPYQVPGIAVAEANGPGMAAQPGATNRATRRRINEADLVRMQRDGIIPDDEASAMESAAGPVIHDPALARALDLLKGIALFERIPQPSRR